MVADPEIEERQRPSAHAPSTLKSLDTRTPNSPSPCDAALLSGHSTQGTQTWPIALPDTNDKDIVMNESFCSEAGTDTPPRVFITTSTLRTPISRHFPKPKSWKDLYQNLRLALNLRPAPAFPALIDYHDAYPKYRSRDSYNLLIELSIRHTQFGASQWLFRAMVHDKIFQNFRTRVLEVRFLVRTGKWESAWALVTGLTPQDVYDKLLRNGQPPVHTKVPAEMWKELLCMGKRGALRRARDSRWGLDEAGNKVRLPPHEIVNDPAVPGTEAFLRRQKLLSCIHPTFGLDDKSTKVRPQLVKYAVSWMLSNGKRTEAEVLVKMYLSQLPPYLREETVAQCMDIIHTLLSKNSEFNANRRLLLQLVKVHPSLKPSSTTLRLILAPLKRLTKCGTIALRVMKDFQKRWGNQIVDSSVRSKVANLAEKQGSRNIMKRMLREDKKAGQVVHVTESPLTQMVEDTRGLRRPPDRELFPRQSFQLNLWRRLGRRVRQMQPRDAQERIPK